jgi:flagellar M-ring protein FliF
MRTDNPDSGSLPGRVRGQAARAKRWAATLPPAARLGLLIAPLALALAAGYLANGQPAESVVWLYDGRPFNSDEAMAITRALDAKSIAHRSGERGQIGVRSDKLKDAIDTIEKKKVGPITIADLEQQLQSSSIFDSSAAHEEKRNRIKEHILELKINELAGIDSAHVSINRPRTRSGLRGWEPARASVWLKTTHDRKLGSETIQAIQMLVGYEPDLKPDAVSVIDTKGHPYLAAGNPSIGRLSLAKARQEELETDIASRLDWIRDLRVIVRVDAPSAVAAQAPALAPAGSEAPRAVANRGISLDDEPEPEAGPVAEAPAPRRPGLTSVLIQVPRSYYVACFRDAVPRRSPSAEDLQPYLLKTSSLIQTAVAALVPSDELGEVKIITIPDQVAENATVAAPPSQPSGWRSEPWYPVALGLGVAISTLLGALLLGRLARKPVPRLVAQPRRGGSGIDLAETDAAGTGPGPSGRVRDLIRNNPEAAAGVLQRWIGEGGQVA